MDGIYVCLLNIPCRILWPVILSCLVLLPFVYYCSPLDMDRYACTYKKYNIVRILVHGKFVSCSKRKRVSELIAAASDVDGAED